jgi:hypothetical protein
MAGFLLQQGAVVICAHGGQAMPTEPNQRVLVSGMPTATISAPWAVAGCPGIPSAVPPCATGQWVLGTLRVLSNGQFLVIQSGVAVTLPGGVPLLPLDFQTRVQAT